MEKLQNNSDIELQKQHLVQVVPTHLAKEIGLEKALVLQQIRFWLDRCGKKIIGSNNLWIYNSLDNWLAQFPYWSLSKLRRIISDLEHMGLLLSKKVNAKKWNQTKWYSINFIKLNKLFEKTKNIAKKISSKLTNRSVQNEQMNNSITKTNCTKNSPSISPPKVGEVKKNHLEEFIKRWNDLIYPITKAQLTETQVKRYSRAISKNFSQDLTQWDEYLNKITASNFLMGRVTAFKITLEWALKHSNIERVKSGQYQSCASSKEFETPVRKLDPEKISTTNQSVMAKFTDKNVRHIMEKLKQKIGDFNFFAWFKDVSVTLNQQELKIATFSRFKRDYIETNYGTLLENIVKAVVSGTKVKYLIPN